MQRISRIVTVLAVCTTAVTMAACSSSSGAGSSSSSGSSSAASSAASSASTASSTASGGSSAAALAKAYAGVQGSLPTKTVAVKKGVNFWVVSCGQLVESCSSPAAAAVAAAKSVGWQTHTCDGQLNPAGVSSCVRQAVAAKAAAVDVIGFDCPKIKQALVEANAAGVKTIGGGGFDCAELGDEQVYSGTLKDLPQFTNHQWWAELGTLQADWVIGATNGTAKVLSLQFTDEAWGADIQTAFAEELATCSGCSIVKTIEIGNADVIGGTLRAKFSTALLQSPTVNAVNAPVDGWFPAGLAQAVVSSGRAGKLKIIGGLGQTPNMGYIAKNAGENASAAFSTAQSGWASVDIAARLLAGQTAPAGQFSEGLGLQVVDATHNLPPTGQPYQPTVDFEAAYAKLWKLG